LGRVVRCEVCEEKVGFSWKRTHTEPLELKAELPSPVTQFVHAVPDLVFVFQSRHRRRLARTSQWIGIIARIEFTSQPLRDDSIAHSQAGQAVGLGKCAGDDQVLVLSDQVHNRFTRNTNECLIDQEPRIRMPREEVG
jgi:hypothetical protein